MSRDKGRAEKAALPTPIKAANRYASMPRNRDHLAETARKSPLCSLRRSAFCSKVCAPRALPAPVTKESVMRQVRVLAAAISFGIALFALAPLAHAGSACLLEGQVMGQPVNECTQTDQPVPEEVQQQQCNGSVPGLAEMGGQVTARRVESCPAGANGVCESPMGTQARIHYYKRSPEQIAAIKQACEMQRGRWVAR
ncbi:hypothetical protein [Lysobacter antibioticus]|uniref:hypothetical protein n=1 Tax=Lysobacter antibioticus TaxID=84531 RepID=UPI0011404328|nr:hypothetical protein [Lysobacter antibioticus]